jgi:hypothetical protein
MQFNIRVLVLALLTTLMPLALDSQEPEEHRSDYLYGLYYGSWDNRGSDLAIVISPDGRPIPPKANDPSAPTKPGFYVGEKWFEFASSQFSPKGFSFQSKSIAGKVFSFQGRFGCERVEEIEGEVPYLEGELKEMQDGCQLRKKKLHFGHAAVL